MSPRAKPVSFDRVEKLAGNLPGVELSTYFGMPALKVDDQMMACMASHKSAEPDSLVVRVDFLERDLRIANEPEIYYVKPHYLNYPCVLTRLSRVSDSALRDLLETGYKLSLKKKVASPARRKNRTSRN